MSNRAMIDSRTQAEAIRRGVDVKVLPTHIALIMDGNGRWAQRRGMPRLLGHREGYRTLRTVLLSASEVGVRYLTAYAFSAENWKRPADEVAGLMKLIEKAARTELSVMHRNNVRVRVAGRLDGLPSSLRDALEESIETTRNNAGIGFTLAINYGGRAEVVDAVREIVREGVAIDAIDEETVSDRLYNPDVPEPDLMIRTAGEMRWSNFLIWQAAYTELVVTDVDWPDFNPDHLFDAIAEYQGRVRKYGGL
ncbi:MAG TPA: polyprenyl diphosphate synthase [Fimbriimonadaceae bacterium]|nr:polyprenyl diphosphate synthase [Fimbriimonadaceae bacterium]HRJ97217.1 polyprenyl diphosphate synthase [Fimbriimonadaceae bacterium]